VDTGASANMEVVDKFCYLCDMLSVEEMLMQLWRPESELDGINSGSWYHCLPIGIYHTSPRTRPNMPVLTGTCTPVHDNYHVNCKVLPN